jgi:hypothetical protein
MSNLPPHLSLAKGGEETEALLQKRLSELRTLPAGKRIDALISFTDPRLAIRRLPPAEVYTTILEAGIVDAAPLIPFLTPKQMTFCMDFELWDRYDFAPGSWQEWLPNLVDGGEEAVANFCHGIDRELLLLILDHELTVTGGMGEFMSDEERLGTWDHTYDGLYYLDFKSDERAPFVGRFVELLRGAAPNLYVWLMEALRGVSRIELEDLCCQFRLGRLADEGFPDPLEAASVYAPLNPATFSLRRDKELPALPEGTTTLPTPLTPVEDLLGRILAGGIHPFVLEELNWLVNCALMAEGNPFGSPGLAGRIMERVHGRITIALQHLAGSDEERARAILESERLITLFRLGNSLVVGLRALIDSLVTTDHATGRLVKGLQETRPRYYRGLDPDSRDDYREFRDLADVERLRALAAAPPG